MVSWFQQLSGNEWTDRGDCITCRINAVGKYGRKDCEGEKTEEREGVIFAAVHLGSSRLFDLF